MFTKLVKTSVPSNYLVIPVIVIAGWWSFFINQFPVFENSKTVVLQLFPVIFSSPVWYNVISIVFILLTAFLMIPFSTKYFHGISGNTLPSFVFIVLASVFCWVFQLGPVIISGFFCMLVFQNIFETYHLNRVFHLGFLAGFYSAVATLVYVPALSFILVSWMGFILMRTFKFREFIIIIIGFIVPVLITHALFMINGNEREFYDLLKNSFAIKTLSFPELKQILFLVVLILIVLWSIGKAISSGSLKKIVLKRYFETFVSSIIFFILSFIFLFLDFKALGFILIPLSFLVAISVASIRKQLWVSLFLLFLIILQIVSQIPIVN